VRSVPSASTRDPFFFSIRPPSAAAGAVRGSRAPSLPRVAAGAIRLPSIRRFSRLSCRCAGLPPVAAPSAARRGAVRAPPRAVRRGSGRPRLLRRRLHPCGRCSLSLPPSAVYSARCGRSPVADLAAGGGRHLPCTSARCGLSARSRSIVAALPPRVAAAADSSVPCLLVSSPPAAATAVLLVGDICSQFFCYPLLLVIF
jgi:hypothetical protein